VRRSPRSLQYWVFVPVGGWWTFAVEHGQHWCRLASPEAAVTAYLGAGPLGSSTGELAFTEHRATIGIVSSVAGPH